MSDVLLQKGTSLRLRFKVTEPDPPIEVDGAMIRSAKGKKMMLEFYNIRKEEEDRLRRLIPILYTRQSAA